MVHALGLIGVTLFGAWLGLLAVGTVKTPVGPMDTTMALRPSTIGGTQINVSPLGSLDLDSHRAPLRLDVDVDRLDADRAGALVDQPARLEGLQSKIADDVRSGAVNLAIRSGVAVLAGATALGLAVYRRPRRALAAGGLALALLAASGASALVTWNPKSVLEPRFSGLLAGAPSLVGDARSIVSDFDVYQRELARLMTNVTKLYDAASTLPAYQPKPDTTRVLHVSDIHLNPAAWTIITSLVKQYEIDVIIDSGDTMDHGTAIENGFLDAIPELGAPYVWVRGNHDSATTQKAMERLARRTAKEASPRRDTASGTPRGQPGGRADPPADTPGSPTDHPTHGHRGEGDEREGDGERKKRSPVYVLDEGVPMNVAGLRLAGWGDPQFTPDRSVVPAGDPAEREAGQNLADALRAQKTAGTPVDIAVAHNPVLARETDGQVPLVLAGHVHRPKTEVLEQGTRLKIEGSTGGGGLRAVEGAEPEKVLASVLYLDRRKQLQAWDQITLGGLGRSTAEVSRHLAHPPDSGPAASPVSPTPDS
nr:metallophosphoesterase [Streptomyces sp. AJS327]